MKTGTRKHKDKKALAKNRPSLRGQKNPLSSGARMEDDEKFGRKED